MGCSNSREVQRLTDAEAPDPQDPQEAERESEGSPVRCLERPSSKEVADVEEVSLPGKAEGETKEKAE